MRPHFPRPFSAVDHALLGATLASPSPDEQAGLAGVLRSGLDWVEFQAKVRHNDIAPLVHGSLQRQGLLDRLPPALAVELADRHAMIDGRNRARLTIARRLFDACTTAGVPVIVLKGAVFAESIYGDIGYKKMNDVDLLIRFADVERVRGIYEQLGLVPLALLEGAGDKLDERKGYHLPAYISKDLTFVVGTHWSLCSPKRGYVFDLQGIWRRARPARVGGAAVLSLAPDDALLHLIVHFHYYKTGLKELADFANLVRSAPTFDWQGFAIVLDSAQAWAPAFRTLSLVETLYRVGVPASLLARCRAKAMQTDRQTVHDTERLADRRDLLLTSRSTYSSEIEKAWLSFTFEPRPFEKWRWFKTFWQRLLFPPDDVLYRTNICKPGERRRGWLWLINFRRTAREVGAGWGLPIFGLMMVKSGSDLLAAWARTGLGLGQPGQAADLRKTLGVDENRLRELMEAME